MSTIFPPKIPPPLTRVGVGENDLWKKLFFKYQKVITSSLNHFVTCYEILIHVFLGTFYVLGSTWQITRLSRNSRTISCLIWDIVYISSIYIFRRLQGDSSLNPQDKSMASHILFFAMALAVGWRPWPWRHPFRTGLIVSQTDKNKHVCNSLQL